jgi:O-antigen ligase
MIAAHPLLGHGPGSSRVASAAFVAPGDTWGPDFMHNTVLQTMVEQGVPAGAVYAGLLLLPLALALARWGRVRADPVASGAFYGMVAYLITQMSSNSLNVYADQQFFFWSLAAILVLRLRAVWDAPGKASTSANPRLAT